MSHRLGVAFMSAHPRYSLARTTVKKLRRVHAPGVDQALLRSWECMRPHQFLGCPGLHSLSGSLRLNFDETATCTTGKLIDTAAAKRLARLTSSEPPGPSGDTVLETKSDGRVVRRRMRQDSPNASGGEVPKTKLTQRVCVCVRERERRCWIGGDSCKLQILDRFESALVGTGKLRQTLAFARLQPGCRRNLCAKCGLLYAWCRDETPEMFSGIVSCYARLRRWARQTGERRQEKTDRASVFVPSK